MLRLVLRGPAPSVAIGVGGSVRTKSAAKAAWKQQKQTENRQRDNNCDDVSETVRLFTDQQSQISHVCTHQLLKIFETIKTLGSTRYSTLSQVCWWSCSNSKRMRMSPDTNRMCWALKPRQADKNEESAEAPRSQLAVHHRTTQHPLTRSIKHRAEQRAANEQEATCSQSQSRFIFWDLRGDSYSWIIVHRVSQIWRTSRSV